MIKPSQVASQLRRIASAIDRSNVPDRALVVRDLNNVLIHLSAVIPIWKHKDFQPKGPILVEPDSSDDFKFKSTSPDQELMEHYERNEIEPSSSELEIISHIKQISDALSKGYIGFEWCYELMMKELVKMEQEGHS